MTKQKNGTFLLFTRAEGGGAQQSILSKQNNTNTNKRTGALCRHVQRIRKKNSDVFGCENYMLAFLSLLYLPNIIYTIKHDRVHNVRTLRCCVRSVVPRMCFDMICGVNYVDSREYACFFASARDPTTLIARCIQILKPQISSATYSAKCNIIL